MCLSDSLRTAKWLIQVFKLTVKGYTRRYYTGMRYWKPCLQVPLLPLSPGPARLPCNFFRTAFPTKKPKSSQLGTGIFNGGFWMQVGKERSGALVWFSDSWNPWPCRSLSVTRLLGTWILWESGYLAVISRGIWNAASHWSVSGQSEEVYCQGFQNQAFGWDLICRANIIIAYSQDLTVSHFCDILKYLYWKERERQT